jgi:hypothetical protein
MTKGWVILTILLIATAAPCADHELITRAERTDFTETSRYADVIDLVGAAVARSPKLRLGRLGASAGGLDIPLVVVSDRGLLTPEEARVYDLPSVLLAANIHAGEVEGKEALQMLLRDAVEGALDDLLDNQVLLVVPIFNVDGNDKLGDNRRDNGPELAGLRYNGQNLDLNRDFMKLATPEVRALIRLIRTWEPVLYVDMHTTNGSYHREPVTYTTLANENGSEALKDYMWQHFFPAVSATLKESYGFHSIPYGNFVDRAEPTKGWSNHAFEARYSTNYVGLRNIFTVLDENYSHADFATRVLSSHAFVRAIVEYTHGHIAEMRQLQRRETARTREGFAEQGWVRAFDVDKLQDVTIESYEFEVTKIPENELDKYPPWLDGVLVKPTETPKDYTVPYFNRTVPTDTIDLPDAYVIPQHCEEAIRNLLAHGITVERLEQDMTAPVRRYHFESIETADRPNQGRVPLDIRGSWKSEEAIIETGSYFVPLHQPLARLIPALLEPEAADSLVRWGFFTSWIVPQWSRDLNPYPVIRLPEIPEGARLGSCTDLP